METEPLILSPPSTEIAESLADIRRQVLTLTGSEQCYEMLCHAMAVSVDGQWRDARIPDWLLLIGPPSSWKTAALMNLKGPYARFLDTAASAASFLSGMVDMKNGSKARSLLGEIHNNTLVIKDMTALLSDDPKKAKAILGAMTNHFDGEFSKGVGTALQDMSKTAILAAQCRYSFVGAVTPATFSTHQEVMSGMGARMLCYFMRPAGTVDMSLFRIPDLKGRYQTLHESVTRHLALVLERRPEVTLTEDHLTLIDTCARLVIRGRRAMHWYETPDEDTGRMKREWRLWEAEGPQRIGQQLEVHLRYLTRLAGLAEPSARELEMIVYLAIGSASFNRAQVLLEIRERPVVHGEYVGSTVPRIADALRYSISHTSHLVDVLKDAGAVITPACIPSGSKGGRPTGLIEPAPEFRPLFVGGQWGLPLRAPGILSSEVEG
jgi:hypothetical protein